MNNKDFNKGLKIMIDFIREIADILEAIQSRLEESFSIDENIILYITNRPDDVDVQTFRNMFEKAKNRRSVHAGQHLFHVGINPQKNRKVQTHDERHNHRLNTWIPTLKILDDLCRYNNVTGGVIVAMFINKLTLSIKRRLNIKTIQTY